MYIEVDLRAGFLVARFFAFQLIGAFSNGAPSNLGLAEQMKFSIPIFSIHFYRIFILKRDFFQNLQ